MVTIIELVSPTDTITFYPTPDVNGWVYNNVTLDEWYALAEVDADLNKRPNAHGTYTPGQTFTKEHRPILSGQRYDTDPTSALLARQRLSALYSDGNPIIMRVTDELGPTTRTVWLLDYDAPFKYGFDHFPLDLVFVAPDPRRYGPAITVGPEGMPSAGSGLVWDLGTAGSGLYFDWGTAGVLGQVVVTNTGGAATFPVLAVGDAGGFDVGFRITEVETGRELTVVRVTNPGEIITLDSRTQRATINNGGDITGTMSSRDWFTIPAGATRRYQINPLGSVTGSPTMTLVTAPAYL